MERPWRSALIALRLRSGSAGRKIGDSLPARGLRRTGFAHMITRILQPPSSPRQHLSGEIAGESVFSASHNLLEQRLQGNLSSLYRPEEIPCTLCESS